jgi:hypothetical protein
MYFAKKLKDGQMELNDSPEKPRGRPSPSHTDKDCVTAEGLTEKDHRAKVHETALEKKKGQYYQTKAHMPS